MSATRQPPEQRGRNGTFWKRTSVANGHELCLWGFDQDNDLEARRLAAAIPRGTPHVTEVETHPGEGSNVWLEPPADGLHRFHPPEGWRIANMSHFDDGHACLRLVPEEVA